MNLQEFQDFIDGKPFTLEGIEGTICVRVVNGMTEYEHVASPTGKETEAYRLRKAEYKDDYVTVLTQCDDAMGKLFEMAAGK